MNSKLTKSPMSAMNMTMPISNLHNSSSNKSNCYHVKNKSYLPTVTSTINKTMNYRHSTTYNTISKETPDKRLNRKIIDYLNTTPSMTMTKSLKANNSSNQLGIINKRTYEIDENIILNQELKSSNNILISLHDIVNNLNNKLEQMAQDNYNLGEYYQKEINRLRNENDFMRNCNEKDKEGNAISAHMQLLNEEEEQLSRMLKQKKTEMKRIENRIEKVSNDIKIQQNEEVPTVNSYYKAMIKKKEQKVDYLNELNKGNVIMINQNDYLLPKSLFQSLTCLLRLKISLLSEHINKDFFVQSLLECNKTKKIIDCRMITEKFVKLTHNTNAKDRKIIQIYFQLLFTDGDNQYCNINHLKEKLQWFINGVKEYDDNEHMQYTAEIISLLRPHHRKLNEAFHSKDIDNKGLITLDIFNHLLRTFNIHLDDFHLFYLLYIMRKSIDKRVHLLELNYNDLIAIIKPQKKVDNYIERIRSHIEDNDISIGDFLKELMNSKMEKIQELKYLENDHMNDYLKEKGVLTDDEELDKDNTPELINVDFLMNLFEQDNKEEDENNVDCNSISQCIEVQERFITDKIINNPIDEAEFRDMID